MAAVAVAAVVAGVGTFEFLPGTAGDSTAGTSSPGALENLTPTGGVQSNYLITPSAGNFNAGKLDLKLQPDVTVSQLQVYVPDALASDTSDVVLNLPSTGSVGTAMIEVSSMFSTKAVTVSMNKAQKPHPVGTGKANVTAMR